MKIRRALMMEEMVSSSWDDTIKVAEWNWACLTSDIRNLHASGRRLPPEMGFSLEMASMMAPMGAGASRGVQRGMPLMIALCKNWGWLHRKATWRMSARTGRPCARISSGEDGEAG